MKERDFQAKLIKRIKQDIPGSVVIKNDASYMQGVPDLVIFYKDRWAMLECKKSSASSRRPNQDYYVNHFNEMSFASYISPENEEEVFDALQQSLGFERQACFS